MKDQHEHITGYRNLNEDEIELINEIKSIGIQCGILVDRLREGDVVGKGDLDQRWVSIGATHIQQGFMALIRAVAQPETFA